MPTSPEGSVGVLDISWNSKELGSKVLFFALGPAEITHERKIRALDACTKTCIALSYSWPGFKQKAEALALARIEVISRKSL